MRCIVQNCLPEKLEKSESIKNLVFISQKTDISEKDRDRAGRRFRRADVRFKTKIVKDPACLTSLVYVAKALIPVLEHDVSVYKQSHPGVSGLKVEKKIEFLKRIVLAWRRKDTGAPLLDLAEEDATELVSLISLQVGEMARNT